MAQHFTVAWLDRWLKDVGEPGFGNADSRLLDDVSWRDLLSFYFRSKRDFPDRVGVQRQCDDLRAGCLDLPEQIVERVAGPSRIETAAAVTERSYERSDVVVLARADSYADALVGGPLAASLDAPLLITGGDRLSPATATMIEEIDAREAVLLGGTAALGEAVVADLEALHLTVRRVAGPDRFATAVAVAEEIGGTGDVLVAQGIDADPDRGWPDALAAGAFGSIEAIPVLLTGTDVLPEVTAEAIADRDVIVVGGTAAVSATVESALEEVAASFRRISGDDRYGTAAAVMVEALDRGQIGDVLHVATGADWPDSLVAGSATGRVGGLFVLVPADGRIPPVLVPALNRVAQQIESVRVVGGPAVLNDGVLDTLAGLFGQ